MKHIILAVTLFLALSTPAHALMITSGSVLADPAGECRWFYAQKRCFR